MRERSRAGFWRRVLVGGCLAVGALQLAGCAGNDALQVGPAERDYAATTTNGLVDNGFVGDPGAWATQQVGSQSPESDLAALRTLSQADSPAAPPTDRLVIQTGKLAIEVPRPEESIATFRAQVATWGGYLQSQSGTAIVARIPAQRFEEAWQWVRSTGRVLSEWREAEDVTDQFVDLAIRIDNARKSRDRLLEVLQKAEKIEDILRVETELRRLTEEIERMEGQKKLLGDRVAMASLAADFRATALAPVARRQQQPSRFAWINRVGAERVMEDF